MGHPKNLKTYIYEADVNEAISLISFSLIGFIKTSDVCVILYQLKV